MAQTMQARFAGTCPKCRLAIIPGHTITKGSSGWGHYRCVEGKDDAARAWIVLKNAFAQHEREQENAAYEAEMRAEMRAEAELFEKHEGMPPV